MGVFFATLLFAIGWILAGILFRTSIRYRVVVEAALLDARAHRLSPDSETYRALVEAGMVTKGESDGIT